MKSLLLTCILLISSLSFAQQSVKVTIKFTYKGNPMCYWDVTLKQGDVEIAKAKTNDKGEADFGYCRLAYNGVDAYGYKKTANGEKKWDVKGYIGLNEQGHCDFDFQQLVEEMGMGGMIESAWGLTLNDCGSGGSSSSGGTTGTVTTKAEETKEAEEEEESYVDKQMREYEEKREQDKADWESGKTQAEGIQNSKEMYENKIANLTLKIQKKQMEQAKMTAGTKEHSEASYEIRDLELEKDLTQLKLDKTNKMIEKGNVPLSKSEKLPMELKENEYKAEQDSLKTAQKSGALYGQVKTTTTTTTTESGKTETPEKTSNNPRNNAEEEEVLKFYTAEELAALSVMNLKKLKIDYNGKITNRKLGLKTKSSFWTPEKIEMTKQEIVDLEQQVILFEAELEKRKESEE